MLHSLSLYSRKIFKILTRPAFTIVQDVTRLQLLSKKSHFLSFFDDSTDPSTCTEYNFMTNRPKHLGLSSVNRYVRVYTYTAAPIAICNKMISRENIQRGILLLRTRWPVVICLVHARSTWFRLARVATTRTRFEIGIYWLWRWVAMMWTDNFYRNFHFDFPWGIKCWRISVIH